MANHKSSLKETEVAKTSLNTYRAVIKNILSIIGEKNLASSINKEKLQPSREGTEAAFFREKGDGVALQVGATDRRTRKTEP